MSRDACAHRPAVHLRTSRRVSFVVILQRRTTRLWWSVAKEVWTALCSGCYKYGRIPLQTRPGWQYAHSRASTARSSTAITTHSNNACAGPPWIRPGLASCSQTDTQPATGAVQCWAARSVLPHPMPGGAHRRPWRQRCTAPRMTLALALALALTLALTLLALTLLALTLLVLTLLGVSTRRCSPRC